MVEQKREEVSSSQNGNSPFKFYIYKATGCILAARFFFIANKPENVKDSIFLFKH